ncbi:hypothetical protein [Streptomyces sp. NPDC018584]
MAALAVGAIVLLRHIPAGAAPDEEDAAGAEAETGTAGPAHESVAAGDSR